MLKDVIAEAKKVLEAFNDIDTAQVATSFKNNLRRSKDVEDAIKMTKGEFGLKNLVVSNGKVRKFKTANGKTHVLKHSMVTKVK